MEEVTSYYERSDEENRLSRGSGSLEFARMQELILRFLRPPPGVVLDVGGGAGQYSCWLARQGYEVHLINPVEKHLELATSASKDQPEYPIASINQGDARSLDKPDSSCDAMLSMGPLYHLTEVSERKEALSEARRVLKPEGLLFAVGINRFASLLDGLRRGLIDDPEYLAMLEQDLEDGQHRSGSYRYFTTSVFHRPEELEEEVTAAGFTELEVVAVQGSGWLAKDFDERMAGQERRNQLLELVRAVEKEPSLAGMSQHFMVIARNRDTISSIAAD